MAMSPTKRNDQTTDRTHATGMLHVDRNTMQGTESKSTAMASHAYNNPAGQNVQLLLNVLPRVGREISAHRPVASSTHTAVGKRCVVPTPQKHKVKPAVHPFNQTPFAFPRARYAAPPLSLAQLTLSGEVVCPPSNRHVSRGRYRYCVSPIADVPVRPLVPPAAAHHLRVATHKTYTTTAVAQTVRSPSNVVAHSLITIILQLVVLIFKTRRRQGSWPTQSGSLEPITIQCRSHRIIRRVCLSAQGYIAPRVKSRHRLPYAFVAVLNGGDGCTIFMQV